MPRAWAALLIPAVCAQPQMPPPQPPVAQPAQRVAYAVPAVPAVAASEAKPSLAGDIAIELIKALGLQKLNKGFQNFDEADNAQALDAITKCGALAFDYQNFFSLTDCSLGFTTQLELGMATGIKVAQSIKNQSDPADFTTAILNVLSTRASDFLKHTVHATNQGFCSKQMCADNEAKIMVDLSACEAGFICTQMEADWPEGQEFPRFAKCKNAFAEMMTKVFDAIMSMRCQTEPKTEPVVYCMEVIEGLLLEDPECYLELFTSSASGESCSAECARTWGAVKSQYPVCTAAWSDSVYNMQVEIQRLVKEMVPESEDPHVRKFDDLCRAGPLPAPPASRMPLPAAGADIQV